MTEDQLAERAAKEAAEKLFRAVQLRLAKYLNLTLSVGMKDNETDVLVGTVGPIKATANAKLHFIADPRLFRVKITIAGNIENVLRKRALVKRQCFELIASKREMRDNNPEMLAEDIVDNLDDILKKIVQIDTA